MAGGSGGAAARGLTYYAIIPVRDEESTISRVLESLLAQDAPPSSVSVIDDGSSDGTTGIVEGFCRDNPGVVTLRMESHPERDYRRLPGLINRCLDGAHDCILHLGGDTVLEWDYARLLLGAVAAGAVIAGGRLDGDPPAGKSHGFPRGSGRMVDQGWFAGRLGHYNHSCAWESAPLYHAILEGRRVEVVDGARGRHLRPAGSSHGFRGYGRAMRCIGYYPPFALARCAAAFPSRPAGALRMLLEYATHRDSAGWFAPMEPGFRRAVAAHQRARMAARMLGRAGR